MSIPQSKKNATAIGEAVAKATAETITLDSSSHLSVKELKKSLRVALQDSGVLQNVKSQLRREFIQNGKHSAICEMREMRTQAAHAKPYAHTSKSITRCSGNGTKL